MDQAGFFRQGSPYFDHPLLTAERTAQEVDFLIAQLGLAPGSRILDVGCGFGRHSVELARRGYGVVGIDPSATMIAAAHARAAEAGVTVDFLQVSGEAFVADRPFDAAICLFTTLGQWSGAGDNRGLIPQVHAALRPAGRFAVEAPQRDAAVRRLKPSDRFGGAETTMLVARIYGPDDQVVTETFTVFTSGSTREYILRYRLFSRSEVTELLQQAGFSMVATWADYTGTPLAPDSPIMLLIGEK